MGQTQRFGECTILQRKGEGQRPWDRYWTGVWLPWRKCERLSLILSRKSLNEQSGVDPQLLHVSDFKFLLIHVASTPNGFNLISHFGLIPCKRGILVGVILHSSWIAKCCWWDMPVYFSRELSDSKFTLDTRLWYSGYSKVGPSRLVICVRRFVTFQLFCLIKLFQLIYLRFY